jgi:hypothetical protein
VIDHPAGEETQWDWVELPGPPASWGWGRHAHLLVGALSHSGGWRRALAESEEQPPSRRVAAWRLRAAGRGKPAAGGSTAWLPLATLGPGT